MTKPTMMKIRTKKLGVLIRAARRTCGKNLEECAEAIGVTASELEAYELGEQSPSLPVLEILAYYLRLPLEYFWGNELLKKNGHTQSLDVQHLLSLRQRMIGVMLRKARTQAGMTLETAAENSGLGLETLSAYELGEQAVPLPQLEMLARVYKTPLQDFQDKNGPVGGWFVQQRLTRDFLELSEEMQSFVSKPINQPYLEVAKRLSEMQADKLREVAESLLEITL